MGQSTYQTPKTAQELYEIAKQDVAWATRRLQLAQGTLALHAALARASRGASDARATKNTEA